MNFDDFLKYIPLTAIVGGALYGVGLVCAWMMDASLGVGTLAVSKERAMCLGLLALTSLTPFLIFILTCYDHKNDDTGKGLFKKLLFLLSAWVFPLIIGVLLSIVTTFIFGGTASLMFLGFPSAAIGVFAMYLLNSDSNFIRIPFLVPLVLPTLSFLLVGIFSQLPMQFGGHAGPSIEVRFQDKKVFTGQLKAQDDKMLILDSVDGVMALPRDQIYYVKSLERPVNISADKDRNYFESKEAGENNAQQMNQNTSPK